MMEIDESVNALGEPLQVCGESPKTGYFRDGKCNTCKQDLGSHTVCIEASREFLEFSKAKGNDLSTPMLEHGFEGLKPGNRWCLCAARWMEACAHDKAPRVFLARTHIKALEVVPLALLKKYAADLN